MGDGGGRRQFGACGTVERQHVNARILAFDRPLATRLAKSDTTGNGKSDMVWRASDGGFAVWDMNGGTLDGFFYGIVDNA